MTRIIDTEKARRKTYVSISNNNTYFETEQNKTTIDEAIGWLLALPLGCKNGVKAKQITDMAIHALAVYPQLKWERDIALSQLEEYGICFGEKKRDDLLEVVMMGETK